MTLQQSPHPPVLHITTFGHKNGPLDPAPDLYFDLRGLPNPPKALRIEARRTGLLGPLQEWLFSIVPVRQKFQEVRQCILQYLHEAEAKGVRCVSVGAGCNLGRNRSVTVAEALAALNWDRWQVVVHHRDRYLPHAGKDLPLNLSSRLYESPITSESSGLNTPV
ncbi:hypothetical protein AMATHDRAFT_69130 [Amanita thiersii Skay4041]|uniref:RapZ C-terminal domain-containing protein n=1 Tax=Amanita thiersii Skay4041 TaxID=703135 RepID=A0A2A9NGJ0_9AGAR|nr:hypothetical protein AMATHDRAFT_69130 [Amanita thiersii Skay4041]